jgi:hypothetical protein
MILQYFLGITSIFISLTYSLTLISSSICSTKSKFLVVKQIQNPLLKKKGFSYLKSCHLFISTSKEFKSNVIGKQTRVIKFENLQPFKF